MTSNMIGKNYAGWTHVLKLSVKPHLKLRTHPRQDLLGVARWHSASCTLTPFRRSATEIVQSEPKHVGSGYPEAQRGRATPWPVPGTSYRVLPEGRPKKSRTVPHRCSVSVPQMCPKNFFLCPRCAPDVPEKLARERTWRKRLCVKRV